MATKKARRVVKTELEVGQRWQFGDTGPNLDSTIIKIEGELVHAHDDETPWDVGTFRANHQRLRVDAIVAELRKRAETRRARAVTCCSQGRQARSLEHREAARALDDAADWASKVPA